MPKETARGYALRIISHINNKAGIVKGPEAWTLSQIKRYGWGSTDNVRSAVAWEGHGYIFPHGLCGESFQEDFPKSENFYVEAYSDWLLYIYKK